MNSKCCPVSITPFSECLSILNDCFNRIIFISNQMDSASSSFEFFKGPKVINIGPGLKSSVEGSSLARSVLIQKQLILFFVIYSVVSKARRFYNERAMLRCSIQTSNNNSTINLMTINVFVIITLHYSLLRWGSTLNIIITFQCPSPRNGCLVLKTLRNPPKQKKLVIALGREAAQHLIISPN